MSEAKLALALAAPLESGVYEPLGLGGTLLRLALALAVVLPLAYAAARFYGKRAAGGRALKLIDGVALGPNRGIYLVEVGDQILVVGVTPHQVNLLSRLSDPEAVRKLKEEARAKREPAFPQKLEDALARLRGPKGEGDAR